MKLCLVVDHSSVVRKVASRILDELGFGVVEAADSVSALEICRRTMPDLILLDWSLPSISGVEFLAALRREKGGDRPKVVFCASENDVGQIARAMRAGADDYILKPFDRALVAAKLHEVGLI